MARAQDLFRRARATALIVSLVAFCTAEPQDAAPGAPLVFSAGFTDDAVLQRAPSSAAVYGLVFPASSSAPPSVLVSLLNADGSVAASAAAVVAADQGAGSACDAQCYSAGYVCAVGQSSCCSAPSCPMGCLMAAATATEAACVAECKAAKGTCSYTIPGTSTELDMCGDCLPNCPGCPDFEAQCEQGCAFGRGAAVPPLSFKALLPPQPAGGTFTVVANCTAGCAGGGAAATLRRVTFGDVFYASGQSNMALGMHFSFQKENIVAAIRAGSYSNIRFFQYGGMGSQVDGAEPAWATSVATAPMWPWQNLTTALNATGFAAFDTFSALALHFAAALTDLRGAGGDSAVPIGVITNAVGGTTIEAWSSREMLAACKNTTTGNGAAPATALFYGMVAPFVNTSIASWLWLQGENNCGGDGEPGNSADGTGYGCSLATLVRVYRELWSAQPGTTAADAPFGIFTLHSGASEGSGKNMAGIRWSQSANYGVVPNPLIPNGWITQLFDLGDPWLNNIDSSDKSHCEKVDPATGMYGPNCQTPWTNLTLWDAALLPLAPLVRADATPTFLGSIHARIKGPAGARAALQYHNLVDGGAGPITGPTIAGCSAVAALGKISVRFDAALLRGDVVAVSPFDTDTTAWGTAESNSFMACLVPAGRAPADCATDASMWAPAAAVADGTGAGAALTVAPTLLAGKTLAALRYGWPIDGNSPGDTCCPSKNVTASLAACIPAACPVKASPSLLPANPFFALIVGGKCKCLPPQTCDA